MEPRDPRAARAVTPIIGGIVSRTRTSLVSALLAAAALGTGHAHADELKQYPACGREPTETDVTAAKGAFQAGNASFDEADYPRAIVYWEDAYRRDCTAHGMLLNLARAYELNGNKLQAVLALRTYLERVPTTPDKEKIERRIDVLNKQIEAEKPEPVAKPAEAKPAQKDVSTPLPPAQKSPPARTPVEPIITMGVGGAVTLLGVLTYLSGKGDLKDAESKCPNHVCPENTDYASQGNDARKRVNGGVVLGVSGLAVASAGLVWYVLETRHAQAKAKVSARRVTPVALPGFYGVSYSGRF